MNMTPLLLILCTLSFTAVAEWKEQIGGREFHSTSIKNQANKELVASLNRGTDGGPSISFLAKEDSHYFIKYCATKNNNEHLDISASVNFQQIRFFAVCHTGGSGMSFVPQYQFQTTILKEFNDSPSHVTLILDGNSEKYSVVGFNQAYFKVSSLLEKSGQEWLSRMLEETVWTDKGSMIGFNKYGSTPSDLPTMELYLNRSGSAQVSFNYAFLQGGMVALKYCDHNEPRKDSFVMPSFEVNEIKVKMIGMCHKFGDVDMSYMVLYPATDNGNNYIIKQFEDKAYVKIDQFFYSAKGFKKVLNDLKNTTDGI